MRGLYCCRGHTLKDINSTFPPSGKVAPLSSLCRALYFLGLVAIPIALQLPGERIALVHSSPFPLTARMTSSNCEGVRYGEHVQKFLVITGFLTG